MELSFGSAALAALCNSERRMADRWGSEMSRTVGRRLLDLAASTATTVGRIPAASVATDNEGATTITFADAIVVRGVIHSSGVRADKAASEADRFVISSVDVQERDSR